MIIKRDLYVKRLIAAKHDDFIKVIVGIRRCGKSYLLFNLFNKGIQDGSCPCRDTAGCHADNDADVSAAFPQRYAVLHPVTDGLEFC